MLNKYFQDIFKTSKAGEVREESFYPDLKGLLETWAEKSGKKYFITSLPKKTDGGNPDFRILTARKELVGYIEAKTITAENLDDVESSEQLKRYLSTFPNLILTNFFEFRLYRNGRLIDKVKIGRPFIIHQLNTVPPAENQGKFLNFLDKFFDFSTPRTTTAKTLAIELAKRTRFLRDNVIDEELKEENIEGTQELEAFYRAFKEHLIPSLELRDFSNLFAQTITYGLFAARSRSENGFNRELAYKLIPHTIGILHDVFRFISSTELPETMEWIIDDIAEVLSAADVKKIMENFYLEGKGRDPIIHFYETFLTEYDPAERGKRGVYYTPEPVVGFIVRSIHKLLRDKFDKEDGFATQSVTVLDPAAGTLTFPAEAIRLAIQEFKEKYGEGGINSLIRDHILKDFYAFELMMAPYAVGHLKISLILEELGYKLSDEERFNLFLTNTLDFTKEDPNKFAFIEKELSEESQKALKVKQDVPVMVVMGNPPYSVSSTNIIKEGTEYYKLYESYKERVRKEEKNIQPLSDDYIKFLAFAHWKVKQAGKGIIGMITNNSYLDGLIHRDIRRKFMEDFDEIYILNLHGNLNRQEKTPEEGKDENVFDIQQGVSIVLLVKDGSNNKQINYTDLWGLREEKYKFLGEKDITNTDWQQLTPKEPQNFFVLKDFINEESYLKYFSLEDIFNKHGGGIKTRRDNLMVSLDKDELVRRFNLLLDLHLTENMISQVLKIKDSPYWKISVARKTVIESGEINSFIKIYDYRPFDKRFVYYNPKIIERGDARYPLMKHFLKPNLGLITMRQVFLNVPISQFFITESLSDMRYMLSNRGAADVFPLYIYEGEEMQHDLFLPADSGGKKVNFQQPFLDFIDRNLIFPEPKKRKISYEEILYYLYAILYSDLYRRRYVEFLKIDFPRIPFTKDYNLFKELSGLGKQLVDLHLLNSLELNDNLAKFIGRNGNQVEKIEYNEKEKKIYINNSQFFENIESNVWNYYIGGYQVLSKWLKDRKSRNLSPDDIRHYCKVITSLSKTIEIQKEIDKLYPEVEKNLA